MTVKHNKLAKSPLDSKFFQLLDGILTVPFGYKAAKESAFLENIYWTPIGPFHTTKLLAVRPKFNFQIGDFYSGPTQK